jgi:hypothetical protein
MSHAPSTFRQNDISRLFKAARAAGITARIDIATKDGTTISVVQLTPQEAVEGTKPSPNGPPDLRENPAESAGKSRTEKAPADGLRSWD